MPLDGVYRGGDAVRAGSPPGANPSQGGARDRPSDLRRPGAGAQAGRGPRRSEVRQRDPDAIAAGRHSRRDHRLRARHHDRRHDSQPKPGGGTYHYMAPEQFLGEPATVASDVYALGVLFHVVLTGNPPEWVGPRPVAEPPQAWAGGSYESTATLGHAIAEADWQRKPEELKTTTNGLEYE